MTLPINQIICGDWVDIAETLPDKLLHCIITSPPYWGQRDYGTAEWEGGLTQCDHQPPDDAGQTDKQTDGQRQHVGRFAGPTCYKCGAKRIDQQLGLEKTVEEHIEKLVAGFRVLRQKLRDDGVLFLNYGDKYNTQAGNYRPHGSFDRPSRGAQYANHHPIDKALKQGNLIGLAWRLALALQADGWILRSDTIWAKAISFCDKYSGSTMPESINGWRWEKCRVKTGKLVKANFRSDRSLDHQAEPNPDKNPIGNKVAQRTDCPGCPKCEKNGGLVLRRGSWRPTRAHEYLFQFAKTGNYYCDMEAVKEELVTDPAKLKARVDAGAKKGHNRGDAASVEQWDTKTIYEPSGRNVRDVWTINPQAYPDAHYATFPEALVEPCIKVATSEKGVCPKCGSQWARVVDKQQVKRYRREDKTDRHNQGDGVNSCGNTVAGVNTTTLGWRATCGCGVEETVPAIVYDPFIGSGTVAAVAARLGRNYIGSELNGSYIKDQADFRVAEAETGISIPEQKAGQGSLFK